MIDHACMCVLRYNYVFMCKTTRLQIAADELTYYDSRESQRIGESEGDRFLNNSRDVIT